MSIYELDISWAITATERRCLHWELIASDEVSGVFLTARDDVLAVLFNAIAAASTPWLGHSRRKR